MTRLIDRQIIEKYDIPGPRYTSYPTAVDWTDRFGEKDYRQRLALFGQNDKSLSLYVHIPFCRSLCNFCACNVIIRKPKEQYGDEYLDHWEKEIDMISAAIGSAKTIRQFHLGGGTPTFLTSAQLTRLVQKVRELFSFDDCAEFAVEIDPRTIDDDKLKTLKDLGMNRVSMGVQDFDPEVQQLINRIQPFEKVEQFYNTCRQLGFDSVNFDLIYGLPGQTVTSFQDTIERVTTLRPDRIALYSFAYVPWLKKHQRKLDDGSLPLGEAKLDLFLMARDLFLKNGYDAIAMDHFALKDDAMAVAYRNNRLFRNFMGYTVKPADEYIGTGLTSIGFLEKAFIQNVKTINDYYALIQEGRLPVERGLLLSNDDEIRQWTIKEMMCHFHLDKEAFKRRFTLAFDDYFQAEQDHIDYCLSEGLLQKDASILKVTELGKIFIRNICMGFDVYLRKKKTQTFSRTI